MIQVWRRGSESDFVPGVLAGVGTADGLGEVLGRRRLLAGPFLLYVGLKGSFPSSCSDFSAVKRRVRNARTVLSLLPLVKEEGTVLDDFNHDHDGVVREVKLQRVALEEVLPRGPQRIISSPRFS